MEKTETMNEEYLTIEEADKKIREALETPEGGQVTLNGDQPPRKDTWENPS
jgi:hypothetical protein